MEADSDEEDVPQEPDYPSDESADFQAHGVQASHGSHAVSTWEKPATSTKSSYTNSMSAQKTQFADI